MFDFLSWIGRGSGGGIAPTVLLVLDGWGVAPQSHGNAISRAKTPNIDMLLKTYPHTELIAAGESVGLPANEVGNTEVGHLTIGAGRVIFQDLKRINAAIADRSFYDTKAFTDAAAHVRKYNSKLHIMGLLSSEHVHASREHLYALLQFCKLQYVDRVVLHIFTDGRDSAPKEAADTIRELEGRLKSLHLGQIATIAGRYFAMDRDGRWARTEKAYRAIVEGEGLKMPTAQAAIDEVYKKVVTDEFIEPCVIATDAPLTVDDNDAVIFFNFRVDRARQLMMSFVLPNFENLKSFEFGYVSDVDKGGTVAFANTFVRKKKPQNLFFVTMTEYQKNIAVSGIAFPPQAIADSLAAVISQKGLKQLRVSESEKERFVTYYFGGLQDKPLPGEDRLIVKSPHVPTYDQKPEMAVFDIVSAFKRVLRNNKYQFIVVNFANPDMVAHTGNIAATIKALEVTDKAIGEMVTAVLDHNGSIFITADHGNAEELLTYPAGTFFFTTQQGSMNTGHSNNPVPLIIIKKEFLNKVTQLPTGALSDIAPTILAMMGIVPPQGMTGKNLIKDLL